MGVEELMRKQEELMEDDDEEVELPGFRFHPTDEELVGFYLRRQLDKKPIKIELIKQIDIYKYDPWDLPKATCTGGEKEWYFFCKRGRKYRNSVRPNRVTGSGFWKATGIDKPVYSLAGQGSDCIGLKKTLVYYRGSAGKGAKTDWMMHEFRLPSLQDAATNTAAAAASTTTIAQQAEIWTLCRIFKRNVPPRKHITDWRPSSQAGTKRQYSSVDKNTSSTVKSDHTNCYNNNKEAYINFGGSNNHNHHHQLGHHYYSQVHHLHHHHEHKPAVVNNYTSNTTNIDQRNNNNNHQFMMMNSSQAQAAAQQPQFITASSSSSSSDLWINNPSAVDASDFLMYENWDELGSVVKFALDSSIT